MRVAVGADHGGFDMKNELAKLLASEGHEIVDFGNKSTTPTTTIRILPYLWLELWLAEMWSAAFWCAAVAWAHV